MPISNLNISNCISFFKNNYRNILSNKAKMSSRRKIDFHFVFNYQLKGQTPKIINSDFFFGKKRLCSSFTDIFILSVYVYTYWCFCESVVIKQLFSYHFDMIFLLSDSDTYLWFNIHIFVLFTYWWNSIHGSHCIFLVNNKQHYNQRHNNRSHEVKMMLCKFVSDLNTYNLFNLKLN